MKVIDPRGQEFSTRVAEATTIFTFCLFNFYLAIAASRR